MILGFNRFPIIATAMKSENDSDRFPIVHARITKNEDEKYYIAFEVLAQDPYSEEVEKYQSELMQLIKEETNLNLPYKIGDSYYKVAEGIPGSKYFRMPLGKTI